VAEIEMCWETCVLVRSSARSVRYCLGKAYNMCNTLLARFIILFHVCVKESLGFCRTKTASAVRFLPNQDCVFSASSAEPRLHFKFVFFILRSSNYQNSVCETSVLPEYCAASVGVCFLTFRDSVVASSSGSVVQIVLNRWPFLGPLILEDEAIYTVSKRQATNDHVLKLTRTVHNL
jgi:hypothetical protein